MNNKAKKYLAAVALIFITISISADSPALNYLVSIDTAKNNLVKFKSDINFAVKLLNHQGLRSLPEIEKYNKTLGKSGLFVIDPTTGELLLAPEESTIGNSALKNSEINGKALAREAIREARVRLYDDNNWEQDLSGNLYRSYIFRLAITLEGKVYVVAIGHSSKHLQRLFVTMIVDSGAKLIEKKGVKAAINKFKVKDGLYCFKDTYVFVYQVNSTTDATCVFNPNYPESEGKNIIDLKVNSVFIVKEILEKLKNKDSAWIRTYTHTPVVLNLFLIIKILFLRVK